MAVSEEEAYGMLSGKEVRTGFISGATFQNKPVQFSVVDGLAILKACIVLGTVEEMEKKCDAVRAGKDIADDTGEIVEGIYIELIRPEMTHVTRHPP